MQHLSSFGLKICCLQEARLFIQGFSLPVHNCNCLVTSWSAVVKPLTFSSFHKAQQKHLWIWNVTALTGLHSLLPWCKDAREFICCAMSACGHRQCPRCWHHQPCGNHGRELHLDVVLPLLRSLFFSPAPLSSDLVLSLRVQPCVFLNRIWQSLFLPLLCKA